MLLPPLLTASNYSHSDFELVFQVKSGTKWFCCSDLAMVPYLQQAGPRENYAVNYTLVTIKPLCLAHMLQRTCFRNTSDTKNKDVGFV